MQFRLRRVIVTLAAVMLLVLAFASTSFAGEDGCSDDNSCSTAASSGGGSDTGSATGAAQTGFGGAVLKSDGSTAIPLALAGGSVALLTLAGAAGIRARRFQQ